MGNQTYFVTDRELRWQVLQEQPDRRVVDGRLNLGHFRQAGPERFGGLIVKEKPGTNTPQFLLQMNHFNDREEIVDVVEKHYRSPLELQQEKQFQLQLESLIKDLNSPRGNIFTGRLNGMHTSFVVTPFQRFEDSSFKSILYDHHINLSISSHRHKNLHNLLDAFFLSSGQQRLGKDLVAVMVKEEVAASLAEINHYRRTNNWPWTEMQLELLIYHTLCGLDALHSMLISHGDIRPATIFYSISKHAYVIGGFSSSTKHLSLQEPVGAVYGLGYYQSPEARATINGLSSTSSFNPFKNDVYALGITLLNSFFLATPSHPDALISSAKANLKNSEAILKLLCLMVLPESERPTAKQLLALASNRGLNNYRSYNREDSLIESLRYKRIASQQDAEFERRAIAECYENFFMAEHALQTNTELLHLYEVRNDRINQANYHIKIAESSHSHEEAMQSYQQATRLYREIAENLLKEHRVDESIFYYNKAITACERQPNSEYDLAQLLRELSHAYSEKSAYDLSKTFLSEALNLIERSKGPHSLEYANMLVEVAKVESEFQEYKASENYLKNAVKILEMRENEANPNIGVVKASVLETLGNNLRLKATVPSDKQAHYREKAEQCLQEALALNSNLANNDLKLASNHENLGHVYFDQKELSKACRNYEAALLLRKHTGDSSIEIGQTLTYVANCNKFMNEQDKAIKNYNDALEIFRKEVGNDHNQYTAVALGNLGLVYRDMGRDADSREYLRIAKGILRDLYGEDSVDYQYFSRYG